MRSPVPFDDLQDGAGVLAAVSVACLAGAASADPARNVVLVHGAFADGSGWKPVAEILQAVPHTLRPALAREFNETRALGVNSYPTIMIEVDGSRKRIDISHDSVAMVSRIRAAMTAR